MTPLFFSLGNLLQLMVIRDPEARLYDKSTLTKNYNIFQDMALSDPRQSKSKEASLHPERVHDPEYYGFLSLASPESQYTYTADGIKQLSDDEVEQLIEMIKA